MLMRLSQRPANRDRLCSALRRVCPITDLVAVEFWNAFWECFRCHLSLWRAGIRHLDIGVSNLMYDRDIGRGILNDFDLARPRGRSSLSGTARTGTMPFMAMDLLRWDGEAKREYRHDVESFGWVLLWICCTYESGRELPKRPLQAVIQPSFEATYKEKSALILGRDLKPTASYSQEYLRVAVNLITRYQKQHDARKYEERDRIFGSSDSRGCEPDPPESVDDEVTVDAELRNCRGELASAKLPANLF